MSYGIIITYYVSIPRQTTRNLLLNSSNQPLLIVNKIRNNEAIKKDCICDF